MPTLPPTNSIGPMSSLTWGQAIARIAGVVSGARLPDAQGAARDALSETLQDWDTRHDWKFTQVVAPDILIDGSSDSFALPTTFKTPYVAYLHNTRQPLFYIERGNWHRMFPGEQARSTPKYYTLYNSNETGVGDLFPGSGVADTLVVLYYRSMTYNDDDGAMLDILQRWEGYILDGAKAKLCLGKVAGDKADRYQMRYEMGIKKAKENDRRVPDQFLAFQAPVRLDIGRTFSDWSTDTWGWGGY